MFVVFESDKRVHCSLLHCVCAHVRVYGWLHSLHSTVIDMSVRHCPANEMTSLIDRALTRLHGTQHGQHACHKPHAKPFTAEFKPDHSGQKKAAHFKKSHVTSKIQFHNLLKDSLFLLLHKTCVNYTKNIEKIKKTKYILECFLDKWFSHSASKLHRIKKPLQKPDLLCEKNLKCFQTAPHSHLHWALPQALVLTQL